MKKLLFVPFLLILVSGLVFAQYGTIKGKVTNAKTGEPLVGANVLIKGLVLGSATDIEGNYTITRVPPGRYTVEARYVGFKSVEKRVSVSAGETVTLNFELEESPLKLDEVVVTGQAREAKRREIGTAIASIDVREFEMAPVQDLSQLLQAREPGVTILPGGGKVGQGTKIILRGPVSVSMGISPIIYVDGIRIDNSTASGIWTGGFSWSGFEDINPADIERIEIVKGASAGTIYGTEAAAGVIQIFTKSGRTGRPTWTYSTKVGYNYTPKDWWKVSVYSDWFYNKFVKPGFFQEHNLSVRGGISGYKYYVSGTYRLSHGVLPDDIENYKSFRTNIQFLPRDNLVMRVNMGYSYRWVGFVEDANNIYGIAINGLGAGERGLFTKPEDIPKIDAIQRSGRFTGGVSIEYLPFKNFSNKFTFGADIVQYNNTEFFPYGAIRSYPRGRKRNYRRYASVISLEYVGNYKIGLFSGLTLTLTGGFQSYTRFIHWNRVYGRDFPAPGLSTVNAAAITEAEEDRVTIKSAGFFLQGEFGIGNMLFLTIGSRLDGHSAFGEKYPYQFYPKVSLSYVISEHEFWPKSFGSLRLRAAFGEAGRQPGVFDAVRTWVPVSALDGLPAVTTGNIGNPKLGPEISKEFEGGFDYSVFGGRFRAEFTYYHQRTEKALLYVLYPPSNGFLNEQLENVGKIQNTGIELKLNALLLNLKNFRWDAQLNLSTNKNKIIDLGPQPEIYVHWTQKHRPGYPVGSFFSDRYVLKGDTVVVEKDAYIGPPFPTRTMQIWTNFTIFKRINVSILFDHAGGHYVESATFRWLSRLKVPANDPIVPDLAGKPVALWCQDPKDPVLKAYCDKPWPWGPRGNVVQPADYWKLREVTISYSVPARFIRQFGLRALTVFFTGRNLWRHLKAGHHILEAEANYATSRDYSAQEYFITPVPQQYYFGIRVNF